MVSQVRRYFTVQHLDPGVTAGDKVHTAVDPEELLFGLIFSSMFMVWQRTVGGGFEVRSGLCKYLNLEHVPRPGTLRCAARGDHQSR